MPETSAAIASGRSTVSGQGTVSFTLSPPLYVALADLAISSGEPAEDLIRKGIAMIKIALDARNEGKVVGIARLGEPLETVIDVFGPGSSE